ncbi:MAG: hypothetical protein AAF199_04635, partial [Pseudomonadota bacterium]
MIHDKIPVPLMMIISGIFCAPRGLHCALAIDPLCPSPWCWHGPIPANNAGEKPMAPATHSADTTTLLIWCRDRLNAIAGEIDNDPMINSVQRLSHLLAVRLEEGTDSLDDLEGLARLLSDQALRQRADRFVTAHPPVSAPSVPAIAADAPTFEAFAAQVERTGAGIVFTGHPTFALSRALRQKINQYIDDRHKDDGDVAQERTLTGLPHR